MTILQAAIEYCKKGYSVIPVLPNKKPLIKWESYQKKKASEEEIREWFKKWPDANIGIVTGEISNLFVVDTDSPESSQRVRDAIPDSLVVPLQSTPSGGNHFLFSHTPGFSNRAKVAHEIDIRTTGGYFVAAPSINGNGKGWEWVISPLDADPPELIFAVRDIISKSLSLFLHEGVTFTENNGYHDVSHVSQGITRYFNEGERDEHLIHAAICLQKGGSEPDFARYILNILVNSWGENDPKWVDIKIKSAWDRASKRDRNIAQEVRTWVEMMRETSQGGNIEFTTWQKESQVSQKKDLHAARMAFKRLCEEDKPIIEKTGERAGQYRLINSEDNEQKWWMDEGKPLDVKMPLGVDQFCKVFMGNIILLEGQKSQGKSTFALEFSRLNNNLYPGKKVVYQNVEMADSELKDRFVHYQDRGIIRIEEWMTFLKVIKQTEGWADKIEPDSINVIDYLLEYDKPYILPKFIFNIHKKLKTGIALVIVQRDPFKPFPVGGRGVRDIPRVILSLINHTVRLEDVKSFYDTGKGNPTGLSIKYKQVAYCEWIKDGEWERVEEARYDQFRKQERNRYGD